MFKESGEMLPKVGMTEITEINGRHSIIIWYSLCHFKERRNHIKPGIYKTIKYFLVALIPDNLFNKNS